MSYPKYLPRKEKFQFRIEHEDLTQLKKYAEIKDITTTSILTGLIHDFLEDKTLSNDYMINKLGFIIRLPLDLELKKTLINKDISSFSNTGEFMEYVNHYSHKNEIRVLDYESETIPNNCDVWLGETFGSRKKGIKHEGVLTLITPQLLNIGHEWKVEDLMYFLNIQILEDNTYKVLNIDYLTALNNLKKGENFRAVEELKEIVEKVEEALASVDCISNLWNVANEYNKGEMKEKTLTLTDAPSTVKTGDDKLLEDMIMESDAFKKMVDEMVDETIEVFKDNEEFMELFRIMKKKSAS